MTRAQRRDRRQEALRIASGFGSEVLQRSPDAHQALVAANEFHQVEGKDGHRYAVAIEGWQQRAEPDQVELLVVVTDGSLRMGLMPVVWRAEVRRR